MKEQSVNLTLNAIKALALVLGKILLLVMLASPAQAEDSSPYLVSCCMPIFSSSRPNDAAFEDSSNEGAKLYGAYFNSVMI